MKKFLFIALFFQAISVFADDITIAPFKIKKGETKTVEIVVENANDLPGTKPLSCNISLPKGLNWEGTNANAKDTERLKSSGMKTYQVNPTTNVLKLTTVSAVVDAGSGTMWTFDITAASDFEGGVITLSSKNINGVKFADSTTQVDVDEDAPARTDLVYIADFAIEKGKTMTVEIILNNAEPLLGTKPLSCNISLPEGLNWEGTNANATDTERLKSAGMKTYQVNPTTNVLKLTTVSAVVDAGFGPVWTFQIKADEDFAGGPIKMTSINVNGVKQPDVEVTVTAAPGTGIDNAIVNVENNAVVYDLVGRQVNANAKGILIKNGKKFIVK